MQTTNSDHNVRIRLLSESWIEQAGSGFDLAILVLAVVNVVAACAVISTIFYDAHVLAKLRSVSTIAYTSSSRGTSRRLVDIHPAEILPLAVSIATTVQGVVYIVIQSIGLHTLVADCEIIAQVVWPGEKALPRVQNWLTDVLQRYGLYPTPCLSLAPRLQFDPSKAIASHAKGGVVCSFASWQYLLRSF